MNPLAVLSLITHFLTHSRRFLKQSAQPTVLLSEYLISCLLLFSEVKASVQGSLTLGAHAQRGWVCVSVCYSQSHFSSVRLSHKGYDLLNGQ